MKTQQNQKNKFFIPLRSKILFFHIYQTIIFFPFNGKGQKKETPKKIQQQQQQKQQQKQQQQQQQKQQQKQQQQKQQPQQQQQHSHASC